MKKLLFLLVFAPVVSFAQCPSWVGSSLVSSTSIIPAVEKYTEFKLSMSDTTGQSFNKLSYKDEKGFVSVTIHFEQKSELKGTQVVKGEPVVSGVYITGPAERIDKLVKEYFAPLINPCTPKTSDTWYMWNGVKLVYFKRGSVEGIPIKFIELSKD